MSTINEIFEKIAADKTEEFDFSYEGDDMDNNESMQFFLEDYDLGNYVYEDDGTHVILTHPDYDFPVVVVSEGNGDFFSHGIYVFYDPDVELEEDRV